MDRLTDFREVFAEVVVARAGCPAHDALRRAFATVPRHIFLGPGPWIVAEDGTRTRTDDPALVYQDVGFGLAPRTPNGLPSLHASMMAAASIARGTRVMHVGAGVGYYTAILAELVGPTGHVLGYEIDGALAARAQEHLAPWPQISIEARSGVVCPDQPVALVYVNAGVRRVPRAWLDALAPGGVLIVPVVEVDGRGAVHMIGADGSDRVLCPARFVACVDDALDPDDGV